MPTPYRDRYTINAVTFDHSLGVALYTAYTSAPKAIPRIHRLKTNMVSKTVDNIRDGLSSPIRTLP